MIYNGIKYEVSENNVHVINSYIVTNDNAKREFLKNLLRTTEGLKRSEKSMLNEWKAHNIFYQHGWFQDHTADVDFEFKQKWYYKVGYWLVAHLMREIVL